MLASVSLVWGCGGDSTTAPVPEPVPDPPRPTTVTVSPAMAELAALGATVQLRAEVRDQNSNVMAGAIVTWTSSASSVATVNASGLVTGVTEGMVTITASSGSAHGVAVITVVHAPEPVASVEVSPSAETIIRGATLQLTAEAFDVNGQAVAGAEFSWESNDAEVATVDASGLVTGVAEGTATITASSGSAQGTAVITVTTTAASSDREILEAFYHATGGPNWSNSDNWMTDAPLGDWHGVRTDASGRVVGLRLSFNGLSGSIPGALGSLGRLTHLRLVDNSLTGSIPPQLGDLASLESMDLSSNELTGSIPSELGDLANLETMNLGFNDLEGPLPSELGNLSSLTQLWLSFNGLTGSIPRSFLQLDMLNSFYFGNNASLCVPSTPDFLTWLGSIDNHSGPSCTG